MADTAAAGDRRDGHARAARVHGGAIVIDAHSDILMAVADGRVRLRERTPVDTTTARDVRGHYDLPRWRDGGVTAQVCALFIETAHLHHPLDRALAMVAAAYDEIAENADGLLLATSVDDILRAKREGKVAIILSFEGVDPLGGNLSYLRVFHQLGVRMASLTHARSNYFAAGVTKTVAEEHHGLTPLGIQTVRMMNALGIVVDLRHVDFRGCEQIVEISEDPVVFSHVSTRRAFPTDRHAEPHFPFSTATGFDRLRLLRDVARTGGVVCVIFALQQDLEAVIDDITYAVEQIGVEHVGLGTDFYGFNIAPVGAEDVSRLPAVTESLLRRGFAEADIQGILGGNLLRVFRQVWR
jgi:membrane dipeptidase